MTELGGKLIEVERRDIKPAPYYHRAVRDLVSLRAMTGEETVQSVTVKREIWVCVAKPMTDKDFAVFLLKGIE